MYILYTYTPQWSHSYKYHHVFSDQLCFFKKNHFSQICKQLQRYLVALMFLDENTILQN